MAVSGLNDLYASGMGMSARGVAALALLYDLTCSYYPLLRSRWQLCCLTDVAYPLRVVGCGVHGFAMNLLQVVTTLNRALLS